MNTWLVMLLGGLITFSMRYSFVYLLGRYEIPEVMRRALHYVPTAVLSAIVFPELILRDGTIDFSAGNSRLIAGVIAVAIAAWTRNSLLTILVGMAAMIILQLLGL